MSFSRDTTASMELIIPSERYHRITERLSGGKIHANSQTTRFSSATARGRNRSSCPSNLSVRDGSCPQQDRTSMDVPEPDRQHFRIVSPNSGKTYGCIVFRWTHPQKSPAAGQAWQVLNPAVCSGCGSLFCPKDGATSRTVG